MVATPFPQWNNHLNPLEHLQAPDWICQPFIWVLSPLDLWMYKNPSYSPGSDLILPVPKIFAPVFLGISCCPAGKYGLTMVEGLTDGPARRSWAKGRRAEGVQRCPETASKSLVNRRNIWEWGRTFFGVYIYIYICVFIWISYINIFQYIYNYIM